MAETLLVDLIVRAAFRQGDDVISDRGQPVSALLEAEDAERLLGEEPRAYRLEPAPTDARYRLTMAPGVTLSTMLSAVA